MQPKKSLRTRNVFTVLQKSSLPDVAEREMLLAHVLHISRERLIAHREMSVSFWQNFCFFHLERQRKNGTPIAYLTNQKEFYGRSFFVNQGVLVPRPETEMLIEEALRYIQTQKDVFLFDVGTGSGCIPITLNKEVSVRAWGIDISSKALRVAKKNNTIHGTSVQFLKGNLLSPVREYVEKEKISTPLLITANLPYVPTTMWQEEPSIQDEPPLALVGGNDGLDLCRRFIDELDELTKTYRGEMTVLMEMLVEQEAAFLTYVQTKIPNARIHTRHDSCNNVTIITLHLASQSQ